MNDAKNLCEQAQCADQYKFGIHSSVAIVTVLNAQKIKQKNRTFLS